MKQESDAVTTEVRCPECYATIDVEENAEFFVCPGCNAELDIAVVGDGVTLVSGQKDRKSEAATRILEDPFLEDYLKWQMIAIFGILTGCAGLVLTALYAVHDFRSYGSYYLARPVSIVVISVIVGVSLCFIGGGFFLYRYVKKEISRHEDMLKKKAAGSISSQETAGVQ